MIPSRGRTRRHAIIDSMTTATVDLLPYRNPTNLLDLGKDDVIVVSYPRSGGDHVSELLQNIEMKLQYKSGVKHPKCNIKVWEEMSNQVENLERTKEDTKRFFSSKLRYKYLARHANQSKIIYVVRNPKHAAVELYSSFYTKQISFDQFMDVFVGYEDPDNPYNYKTHFMQYLLNVEELKILFLKYEDLEQNPVGAVRNILQHMGLDHDTLTIEDVKQVIQVRKDSRPTSWGVLSKSMYNEQATSIDPELLNKFDRELKVDWRLVKSGTV